MSFAATQPFPLSDLARNQAATFRQQRRVLSITRPLAVALSRVAGAVVARYVLHYAHRFAQQAVWFQGASNSLLNRPMDEEIDPRDTLRASLDSMESDLLEVSEGVMDAARRLQALDGRTRGRARDALSKLSGAALLLRQEVRNFKGAVQAHDANVSAVQAARRSAATPAALAAHLEDALH